MTVENHDDYASKGVAGSALGLGIAGTAGWLLNGGFGNLFGGANNCRCNTEQPVNRFELNQAQEIAILKERSYTDEKIIEAYKQSVSDNNAIKNEIAELTKAVANNDKNIALEKQAREYQALFVNKGFEDVNNNIKTLKCRLDAITKEVIPLNSICPQPLASCVPVSFNSQTITTTDTTTTNG